MPVHAKYSYSAFNGYVFHKRSELEARFPTLVFHFFKEAEHLGIAVRVAKRRDTEELNTGGYAVLNGQYYEEVVDELRWDFFPDEAFLVRCALIA